MKNIILTFVLILFSSLITFYFSSFTNLFLILLVPGILFGTSLTLPSFKNIDNRISFLCFFLYPILWIISLLQYFFLQMITNSENAFIPYIVNGFTAGIGVSIIYKYQFGFKNDKIAVIMICCLSIFSMLIANYIFDSPQDKELNLGKIIAIWQMIVGSGILISRKETLYNSV